LRPGCGDGLGKRTPQPSVFFPRRNMNVTHFHRKKQSAANLSIAHSAPSPSFGVKAMRFQIEGLPCAWFAPLFGLPDHELAARAIAWVKSLRMPISRSP
jgi:hypothetical protein